jgi:hypothetical protein
MKGVLAVVWLLLSVALIIKAFPLFFTLEFEGAIIANVIAISAAAAMTTTSIGLLIRKSWSIAALKILCWLVLLYAVVYVLFGGYDDTGPFYFALVCFLALLSIVSLITARKGFTQ